MTQVDFCFTKGHCGNRKKTGWGTKEGNRETTQGAITVAKESSLGGSNGDEGKGDGKNNTDSRQQPALAGG